MSELTELQLKQAIKTVSGRIEPVTLQEVAIRAASNLQASSDRTATEVVSSESMIRRSPKRYLLAAVAAVLIVIGVIFLSDDTGRRLETVEDPAVTTSIPRQSRPEVEFDPKDDQALATARGFALAVEEADSAAASAFISDGDTIVKLGLWGDSIDEQLEFWQIAGAKAVLRECEALSSPGFFECLFLVDDSVTRAQGLEPLELSATIEVVDGAVEAATLDLGALTDWTLTSWAPYAEWAEVNRPEAYALVYPRGFGRSVAPTDPEIKELNAALIRDYARSLGREQLTEPQP